MSSNRMRVAVIGAGAAGICSARHILSRPHTFQPPVVFERSWQVGGTWVYTEEPETESHQHSSMYRDLRTNLSKELMEFPDLSFDPSLPSFLHHSDVLKYLEEYTEKFNVRPHIKFNCNVTSIVPVMEEGKNIPVSWDVTSQIWGNPQPVTERFDAVMVCVGNYAQPYIPDIRGIDTFQGKLLHSHVYRHPERFTSRSVVLLGRGPSGTDIAIELVPYAKQVTLSYRGPPVKWPPPMGLSLAPAVVRATPNSLICEDGTQLEADTLIFCTGYKYYYPFLESVEEPRRLKDFENNGRILGQGCLSNGLAQGMGLLSEMRNEMEASNVLLNSNEGMGLQETQSSQSSMVHDLIVDHDECHEHLPLLYKHLIHARFPTMAFIGACKLVAPFPLFHCQALYFLAVLEKKCPLPSPEQMITESLKELRDHLSSGKPMKHLQLMDKIQWDYNNWLLETAGFEPFPPLWRDMLEASVELWRMNPIFFRDLKHEVLGGEEFRVISEPSSNTHI